MKYTLCVSTALLVFTLATSAAVADDLDDCMEEVFGDLPSVTEQVAGNLPKAIEYCTDVIESGGLSNEELSRALFARGIAYLTDFQRQLALADFNEAISLAPDSPGTSSAYTSRGNVLAYMREFSQAMADYDRALRMAPNEAITYTNRGRVFLELGNAERAISEHTRAAILDADYPSAYINRASAYAFAGQYDKAIADMEMAIKLQPDNDFLYQKRASINYGLGQYEAASKDLVIAERKNPRDIYAPLWLYLTRARLHQDSDEPLAKETEDIDLNRWPGPIVAYFLGKQPREQVFAAATHPEPSRHSELQCEAHFYLAEFADLQGPNDADAMRSDLERATTICPRFFVEYTGASLHLKRLNN